MSDTEQPLLSVRNLTTSFRIGRKDVIAVDDITFDIPARKTLAIVGESGSGKSVTALSIMGLLPHPSGKVVNGEVVFQGKDLLKASPEEFRKTRVHDISMIFQEPMSALNPIFRISTQLGEVYRLHEGLNAKDTRDATIELLAQVGIPAPEQRIDEYPHQLSGGMRQRVMIAMALACNPTLLIADEPTTALDVTIQAQILDLLQEVQHKYNMAMLLITHDLGVVAEMADEVNVMYAGQIVHKAPIATLFDHTQHPYTSGLFDSLPSMTDKLERLATIEGFVPSISDFPTGCRFHPRCPYAFGTCKELAPAMATTAYEDQAACWLHDAETMRERGRPAGFTKDAAS